MKPVAKQVRITDRPRPECQNQEDGLEGILGVMVITEELPADAEHHGSVAPDNARECCFIDRLAACREPFEQLPVRQPGDCPTLEQRSQPAGQRSQCHLRHCPEPS